MNATLEDRAYEPEHARLVTSLMSLDERTGLSPEEIALAELLTLIIEDYENKCYPLPRVSPAESLKALIEDRGLKHKDIWPVLGNKGSATEVLSGRRSINKAQARRLADFSPCPSTCLSNFSSTTASEWKLTFTIQTFLLAHFAA